MHIVPDSAVLFKHALFYIWVLNTQHLEIRCCTASGTHGGSECLSVFRTLSSFVMSSAMDSKGIDKLWDWASFVPNCVNHRCFVLNKKVPLYVDFLWSFLLSVTFQCTLWENNNKLCHTRCTEAIKTSSVLALWRCAPWEVVWTLISRK